MLHFNDFRVTNAGVASSVTIFREENKPCCEWKIKQGVISVADNSVIILMQSVTNCSHLNSALLF